MYFEQFLSKGRSANKKELNVKIIKRTEYFGHTILHELLYGCHHLKTIKYILKFYILNCKSLFLEKCNNRSTILHLLPCNNNNPAVNYILKFFILNFPYLFLEKNNCGSTIYSINVYHKHEPSAVISKFLSCNFPEISLITNNFILPLMMEMQN